METLPLACTCSRLSTVTGAGVVRSLRRMREPVTMISSPNLSFAPLALVAGVTGPPTTSSTGWSAGAACVGSVAPAEGPPAAGGAAGVAPSGEGAVASGAGAAGVGCSAAPWAAANPSPDNWESNATAKVTNLRLDSI
jgi:hypothetical protein